MSQEKDNLKVMSEIERELFKPIYDSLKVKPFFMPNPIERLGGIYDFFPGQYTLFGSITGTGKTSFLDHNILEMLETFYTFSEEKQSSVHLEFLYYSMERSKQYKEAKFVSWKIFKDTRLKITASEILNKKGELVKEQVDYVYNRYKDWIERVFDHIDMRESVKSVDDISKDIIYKAKRLGIYFHSDTHTVYKFGEYYASFEADKFVQTKYGKRKYMIITHNGIDHTIYENDKLYINHKPTLFFIILDHVGKLKRIKGMTKKETLDWMDDELCIARDDFKMSPIPISQFNRSISATDRLKFNNGDLDPVLEDFKDTSNMTESADLVVSVFEPGRYKSWDSKGNYKGYNIRDAMVTPKGVSRSRSIHVLKNSTGISGVSQLLRFTGESMFFEAMPRPEDTEAIQDIYKDIAKGN